MTSYTYDRKLVAHLGETGGFVIVPDQISDAQKDHDRAGTVFAAYPCRSTGARESDEPLMVRLDGEAYGLWTPGTGDMIVREA